MKVKKCQHFWSWFSQHQQILLQVFNLPHADCLYWLDELGSHVRACNRSLGAQLQLDTHGWQRGQLLFTVGGNPHHFEWADWMVANAPTLEGWEFFSLMPPMPANTYIEMKLKVLKLTTDDIWINPPDLTDGDHKIRLCVYAGCDRDIDNRGRQVLDQAVFNVLGERLYGKYIGLVVAEPLNRTSPALRERLVPLAELPLRLGEGAIEPAIIETNGMIKLPGNSRAVHAA